MMDILTHITQESAYRTVMGEQLGWGACRTLLRSARDGGFLEPVTPSVYQIHPGLPWFYGRSLYRQLPLSAIQQLEAEFVRVYADTADYFMETLYENQDSGTTAILAEEGNLTQALALSLESGQWDSAQLLVQPIAQVFRMQKRYPELRRLRRQLLESIGTTAAEASVKGAGELWLYLLGTEASECVETGELDRAEDMNRQLLDHLSSQEDGGQDPRTAAVYHQMGQVAQKRWRLDEADDWFTKSLEIIEGGEDRAAVADDYYGLGLVRQYQRRYTEAKEWFSKALDIHQRLEDAEEMVKDYRSLGLCAQFRFEYQEAESWYHRAREVLEEARDEETAVLVYHSLGTLCHAQYQFDDAENWYQQSLTLSDRMGNEAQMAIEFHHLGLLTQARKLFYEDAEHWYTLALEKFEKLGDRRSAGDEMPAARRPVFTSNKSWKTPKVGTTGPGRYSRSYRNRTVSRGPTANWAWWPKSGTISPRPCSGPAGRINWPCPTTCRSSTKPGSTWRGSRTSTEKTTSPIGGGHSPAKSRQQTWK